MQVEPPVVIHSHTVPSTAEPTQSQSSGRSLSASGRNERGGLYNLGGGSFFSSHSAGERTPTLLLSPRHLSHSTSSVRRQSENSWSSSSSCSGHAVGDSSPRDSLRKKREYAEKEILLSPSCHPVKRLKANPLSRSCPSLPVPFVNENKPLPYKTGAESAHLIEPEIVSIFVTMIIIICDVFLFCV
eukprot:TRINITY_DN2156_c0_g1_i2.p1 TRINITY_DN2156_c0_g1~~TRINITY_DN2156_c0_g1_i2.p1  ORF type:complete len:212 (+),score=23.82 TRINITY_DN2156_c0_g1_i2:79-636(+)